MSGEWADFDRSSCRSDRQEFSISAPPTWMSGPNALETQPAGWAADVHPPLLPPPPIRLRSALPTLQYGATSTSVWSRQHIGTASNTGSHEDNRDQRTWRASHQEHDSNPHAARETGPFHVKHGCGPLATVPIAASTPVRLPVAGRGTGDWRLGTGDWGLGTEGCNLILGPTKIRETTHTRSPPRPRGLRPDFGLG